MRPLRKDDKRKEIEQEKKMKIFKYLKGSGRKKKVETYNENICREK